MSRMKNFTVFGRLTSEDKEHMQIVNKYFKMYRDQAKKEKSAGVGAGEPDYSFPGEPDDDGDDTPLYNESRMKAEGPVVFDGEDADAAFEEFERRSLISSSSMMFKSEKHTGPEKERKTCIWPGGDPVSWTVPSSGYSWVGVNGNDASCVVSICDPICKRPPSKIEVGPHNVVRSALACMIGDTPFSYRRQIPQNAHAGPVAVVSVAPFALGEEFQQAPLAIEFLKEKLKDCSFLNSEDTEQIAICALKYLLGDKFKCHKIVIHGWKKGKGSWHTGDISKKRVVRAIKKTATMDLASSAFSTYQPPEVC